MQGSKAMQGPHGNVLLSIVYAKEVFLFLISLLNKQLIFNNLHNGLDFQYRADTIGRFLYDYGEKFILSALEDGEYAIAARNYL